MKTIPFQIASNYSDVEVDRGDAPLFADFFVAGLPLELPGINQRQLKCRLELRRTWAKGGRLDLPKQLHNAYPIRGSRSPSRAAS